MKLLKLATIVLIASTMMFACAKAPKKEYDAAQAAVKAAQDKSAEQCATAEYTQAQEALAAAEAKMEKAKNGEGSKSELYEQAKNDLIAAQEKAKAAEAKAIENRKIADQVSAKLAEIKKKIDALEADAGNTDEYNKLVMKYERAKELADDCKAEEAKAMLAEVEKQLNEVTTMVAAEKARALKEKMSKNTSENTDADYSEYKVEKGDSLWKISEMKYYNPFMWPMIYWANKANIKDPDLIYPGQVFKIKGKFSDDEKSDAIKFSKTRGPWSLFDGK